MKKLIKLLIDKAGYTLRTKESNIPKDLRGQACNPLFAKYFARKSNFLINADFKKCISCYRFSCEKAGTNPFVITVKDYLEDGDISYSGSKLEEFYTTHAPKDVAEWFNLEGELHDDLVTLSPVLFVLPWENVDMESRKEVRQKVVKHESGRRGKELSLEDGWGWFGPVSKEWGNLEIRTLVKLTKSIIEKGYLRGNGPEEDIEAKIMVNGSDYKYLITNGNHRLSVLSALDYKFAPVRVFPSNIPAFIYRNEVNFWPNVKNGLYTSNQALKIFDSIFEGEENYEKVPQKASVSNV